MTFSITCRHVDIIDLFHEIDLKFAKDKSNALLSLHALNGCNSASFFNGRTKNSFFNNWEAFPYVKEALLFMPVPHDIFDEKYFDSMEKFIIFNKWLYLQRNRKN